MRHFVRAAIERLDAETLNCSRIISILVSALIFGVVLHGRMFSQPPLPPPFVHSIENEDYLMSEHSVYAQRAGLAAASPLAIAAYAPADAASDPSVSEGEGDAAEPPAEEKPLPLAAPMPLVFSARAAFVTDGPTIRAPVFQKNPDMRLPIASLTKLMTAVVVVERADLDAAFTVSKNAVAAEGPAGGLKPGETLKVGDLLRVLLVVSSNDAAMALEDYFASLGLDLVALMNEKASKLGMANTHFANPAGLDEEGNFSTARDLAALTAYSLKHQTIWNILSRKNDEVISTDGRTTHRLVSNNELLRKGADGIKGSKTGYTKTALGCMITVLDSGSIVVVLGSEDRVGETEKLIQLR